MIILFRVIGYWLLKHWGSIARALLDHCSSIATLLSGRRPPLIPLVGLLQFPVDPAVLPARGKERLDDRPGLFPFPVGHAGDGGKLAVIVRQPARGPIVHDQKHVRAMLGRTQMPRVLQVVPDMQRHAGKAHFAPMISIDVTRT
jgi:hypothetical protein